MTFNYLIPLFYSVLLALCVTQASSAQFLTIEIDVEPEVNASVEQTLDFGQIAANAGQVQFNLGDPSMGIFSIRALRAQRLLITMNVPEFLRHSDLDATIPVNLELAIVNNGIDNWREAIVVSEFPAQTTIRSPENQPGSEWSLAYLYVYGSLTVGNIPGGIYSGDVFLNVEYE